MIYDPAKRELDLRDHIIESMTAEELEEYAKSSAENLTDGSPAQHEKCSPESGTRSGETPGPEVCLGSPAVLTTKERLAWMPREIAVAVVFSVLCLLPVTEATAQDVVTTEWVYLRRSPSMPVSSRCSLAIHDLRAK